MLRNVPQRLARAAEGRRRSRAPRCTQPQRAVHAIWRRASHRIYVFAAGRIALDIVAARVARSSEDPALTIATASRLQGVGHRAIRIPTSRVALDALRLKSFASRRVPPETKSVHGFVYGYCFNLDQVCTKNGYDLHAKFCSISLHGYGRAHAKNG